MRGGAYIRGPGAYNLNRKGTLKRAIATLIKIRLAFAVF